MNESGLVPNAEGFMEKNNLNAYSYNNVTAHKDADGGVTIHFGGDPSKPNHLPITPGWNYIVRLYQPKAEILNGTWKFPEAEPIPSPVRNRSLWNTASEGSLNRLPDTVS